MVVLSLGRLASADRVGPPLQGSEDFWHRCPGALPRADVGRGVAPHGSRRVRQPLAIDVLSPVSRNGHPTAREFWTGTKFPEPTRPGNASGMRRVAF